MVDRESKEDIIFSVVLPCFNEAQSLPDILQRFSGSIGDHGIELILVDNGSTDHTESVLKRELSNPKYAFIRVVKVPVNQGYGHGIITGLREAKGEYLAWSHADMQCDPADIFSGFKRLTTFPNHQQIIVKGARQRRPWKEELLTLGMQLSAQLILGQPLRDINAQPKIFHRSLLKYLPHPPSDISFDLYVMYEALRAGWRIETIPVVFRGRLHGQSKWAFSLFSRYKHIAKTIRYIIRLRLGMEP